MLWKICRQGSSAMKHTSSIEIASIIESCQRGSARRLASVPQRGPNLLGDYSSLTTCFACCGERLAGLFRAERVGMARPRGLGLKRSAPRQSLGDRAEPLK